MTSLFEETFNEPLPSRLRPDNLDEFVGQTHLVGKGKILRRLIETDSISSMIFWGPLPELVKQHSQELLLLIHILLLLISQL